MVLVLVAYLLISLNKVTSKNSSYHFLNLFGVLGIGINVFIQKAWPVFALECIWAIIAVVSLFIIHSRKKAYNDDFPLFSLSKHSNKAKVTDTTPPSQINTALAVFFSLNS